MTKAILEIKEDLGEIKGTTKGIKEKVDAHDTLLKEHGDLLTEINNRTYNLDSWKNGIINIVVEEKEKALATIRNEIKPMKDVFETREGIKKDIKKKIWEGAWEWIKLGIVALITWIMTK